MKEMSGYHRQIRAAVMSSRPRLRMTALSPHSEAERKQDATYQGVSAFGACGQHPGREESVRSLLLAVG